MPEPIRRFIDIANSSTNFPYTISELEFSALWHAMPCGTNTHINNTYYAVGKLALELLPILLLRIESPEGAEAHDLALCLRSHPPFYLIEDDSLELEKAKAAQAIKGFLEV